MGEVRIQTVLMNSVHEQTHIGHGGSNEGACVTCVTCVTTSVTWRIGMAGAGGIRPPSCQSAMVFSFGGVEGGGGMRVERCWEGGWGGWV